MLKLRIPCLASMADVICSTLNLCTEDQMRSILLISIEDILKSLDSPSGYSAKAAALRKRGAA